MSHPATRPVTGSLLDLAPVIPVVVLDDLAAAVPLAQALVAGGVPVIELTLRTPVALAAIEAIRTEVPEILVGAGTVVEPEQAKRAADAGAGFLISPGATPAVLDAMADTGLPHLPGVATVSEAMVLLSRGITEMKFFPAEVSGGAAFLAALASPLPQARFCPTGGITASGASAYLELPNVGCVGGSWLTPREAVAAGDWETVRAAAENTLRLRA